MLLARLELIEYLVSLLPTIVAFHFLAIRPAIYGFTSESEENLISKLLTEDYWKERILTLSSIHRTNQRTYLDIR